jgi:hypothetical protein
MIAPAAWLRSAAVPVYGRSGKSGVGCPVSAARTSASPSRSRASALRTSIDHGWVFECEGAEAASSNTSVSTESGTGSGW